MNLIKRYRTKWISILMISALSMGWLGAPCHILAAGRKPLPVYESANANEGNKAWQASLHPQISLGNASIPAKSAGASGSNPGGHTHAGSFLIAGLAAMAAGSVHHQKSRKRQEKSPKQDQESCTVQGRK